MNKTESATYSFKKIAMLLLLLPLGMMLGSGCGQLWVALLFIIGISMVIPLAMQLMGKLQYPLGQAIGKVAFIVFMLWGVIIVISGVTGLFAHEPFLSSACSGMDAATRIAIKSLRVAGKAL